MRAARLRHSVVVQRKSGDRDDYGAPTGTWVVLATRRAAIEPLNGKEYFANSGEDTKVTTRIRLRYDPALADLTPADRVLDGTVVYNIQSVINPTERNRELILMCERDG